MSPANKIIPSSEISRASILKLTIIKSQSLELETNFEINACGYPLSKRKTNDGLVYIGTKEINVETQEAVNDIIFPRSEYGMGNRHLVIQYSMENKNYYIKDAGEGTGTFIQISHPIILQNEFIISFATSHIFVIITSENELQLKFLDGPNADQL